LEHYLIKSEEKEELQKLFQSQKILKYIYFVATKPVRGSFRKHPTHMAVSSVQLNGIIHNQNLFISLKLHLIFHLRCLYQKPVPTRHQQLHNVTTHETWFSHAYPLNTGCHLYWLADIYGDTFGDSQFLL